MSERRIAALESAIEQAAQLLPHTGPITAFAFLNPLQALEGTPVDQGMRTGARLYDCQPYLSESRYREKLARGRIRVEDLKAVLREDLGSAAVEPVAPAGTRFDLRLAMLQYPLEIGSAAELRWFVAETDALTQFRAEVAPLVKERLIEETQHWVMRDLRPGLMQDRRFDLARHDPQHLLADLVARFREPSIEHWNEPQQEWGSLTLQALWRVCCSGVSWSVVGPPLGTGSGGSLPVGVRHRDVLRDATGVDSDAAVHDVLIRFCAAFTDQGLAHWSLPNREQGFYRAFCALYGGVRRPAARWVRRLTKELARLAHAGLSPQDSILESLELLGVAEEEWPDFICATLLALRGWAGMLWQMETRSDRVSLPVAQGTLIEFLAIRLVLERLALARAAAAALKYKGPLSGLRHAAHLHRVRAQPSSVEQRVFLAFQLAQLLGWSPPALDQLPPDAWRRLISEIDAFSGLERRRIFQQAFERRFRIRALDALAVHAVRPAERVAAPRFQVVCCIDTREESFRRHLEETAPDVETFGAAGFFGVAMYFRGIADAHFAALCPIVIKPRHWVREEVVYPLEETNRRRKRARHALGAASHQVHVGSRSMAGGTLITVGAGVLASIPLVARVLFPRLTARVRRALGGLVGPPMITRLRLERSAAAPGPDEGQVGFTLDEMVHIAECTLREIGLTTGFARIVMFLGHGSFCLNNPHKSAYDCGACSGNPGGANGRALAAILNDVRVRAALGRRGLPIPEDTIFLGGMHNTAVDSITFADLDLLPPSHYAEFELARSTLREACRRNAHERCRRFDSAPLDLSFEAARQHVEGRSEDLAQTRPEFGNATNAVCFVGRRARTRGLFLDRRCFLASYDAAQDDATHATLTRVLSAVVPVCEGINMQYNLSYIDNAGWACGTKLPHNVTSLLGVMDGAASDLRPGLPWQGVEIHEPMRLLFVVEAAPEALHDVMCRTPHVARILQNGWSQLAVLAPDSPQIHLFQGGQFHKYQPECTELPQAASSTDWYRGWRDHLGFAAIH